MAHAATSRGSTAGPPRGAAAGSGTACGRAALGAGAPHVSPPPGSARAHAAAVAPRRLPPQTSAQVHRRLETAVAAIATLAPAPQCSAPHAAMHKVRKPLPALAARVDFWWAGVGQDVEPAALAAPWRIGAKAVLLPWVSGQYQVARTRCTRRKAKLQEAWEASQGACHPQALTRRLPGQALAAWHPWATPQVRALQRASSAVEGRNGALVQRHHQQRGRAQQRDKGWTVLHNFDGRASDGTPPAARFCRRSFPDLLATVVSNIEAVPRPRQRNQAMALTG